MEGEELKMEIEGGRRSKVEGDANTKVLELLKNGNPGKCEDSACRLRTP